MSKKKKKKPKHLMGRKEFLFDFFSIVIVMGIGIYFGFRSIYYYSKQNVKIVEDSKTLNGVILQNNQVITEGDGLYKDTDGYYFNGNVTNNYVLLGNSLFRIIRISKKNSIRIVSEDYVASFPWGEEATYQNSNIRLWLEKGENEHSGIYYNMIPNIESNFVKTSFYEESLVDHKMESIGEEYSDYVSLLTIRDYITAGGNNSFLNTGKLFYLLGYSDTQENLYVEEDGSIQTCDSLTGLGIRPVLTLKENTAYTEGDGSLANPYRLAFDKDNMSGKYVKLGGDIWRVYLSEGDTLRLHLNGYIKVNGNDYFRNYSNTNSIFDPTDKKNIAYYLNNDFLNSLSYGIMLLDCPSYIGEISDDQGYSFFNIYNQVVVTKVGLLNIFDPIVNPDLGNYFYVNTTSPVGSMEYDRFASGLLEESDVRDEKPIVPVVSIAKSAIINGQGTILDPYVVE